MKVNVNFLENLRLEALFDDFQVITDQPVRYKGDGTAPGPFDYFLASSALCAAYFVKVYCNARGIPTENIKVSQQNIISPENRYKQSFHLTIELPENISQKDKSGILASMERCTVKRVIQNGPEFKIEAVSASKKSSQNAYQDFLNQKSKTYIPGKDSSLEDTISKLSQILSDLGINIEIASWRNLIPHVWSVHIRDAESPMCYTNGKGTTKEAALCSALGEYIERISNNYFYNDYYLGKSLSESQFVHYPNEKWFKSIDNDLPKGLMDSYLHNTYNSENQLTSKHLIDTNSGNEERGICALPFIKQSDKSEVFIPVNLIGNLFVSNGMSAGNSMNEAKVQALSEIFERAIKNKIITEELTLPDVPENVLKQYPKILEGIQVLREKGYPVLIKDASLGGKYPVLCVTLMNPKTGGVFASFGAHPKFEIALERSLTELLQGRSFQGLNDTLAPSFNSFAVSEHNNIIDHFIDSIGVISWKFFSSQSIFSFTHWDFQGSTSEEFRFLLNILADEEKEVYIMEHTDLGSHACRILVPNFSEIYPIDDLVWDNHNKALIFRDDILKIHSLESDDLQSLLNKFDEYELDDYMPISELIGVAFDENSPWADLTIIELKCHIYLRLGQKENAKAMSEMLANFSDSTPTRKTFFKVLDLILEVQTNVDLNLNDYYENFCKMFGENLVKIAQKCISGEVQFYGLNTPGENLEHIKKHRKLIQSYQKLIKKRSE